MALFRSTIAALVLGAAAPALAADLPATSSPLAPAPIFETFNPWMIRVRAVGVLPQDRGSATVYAGGALVAGGTVRVSNSVVPEVDISYFFTPNFAIEAICCVSPHTVRAAGALAGLGDIGKTIVFPPTIMAQYHFTGLGAFKPYVGIGVNYTHYFRNGGGAPNFTGLKIDDSWGVAGQIGFDYMLNNNWGINVDVKKIMMQPNATATLLPATPVRAKVKIDPWVVGIGLTYRFGGGAGAVVAKY